MSAETRSFTQRMEFSSVSKTVLVETSTIGFALLKEDGFAILQENGAEILLE